MLLSPRRLLLTAVASVLCLLGGVSAATASASTMPAEGMFDSCPLDTAMATCTQRLAVMHNGGMQVVVMPAYGASLNSLATYAATAHSMGMSVMWGLSNPVWWQQPITATGAASSFSAFASACGCSQNGQLLAYTVHWLSALPGTYGYYAADDSMLAPGDRPGVAAYGARIRQQDPVHTLMMGAANETQGLQYQGAVGSAAQEIYPVTTDSLLPAPDNQATWDSVAATAADTQRAANAAHTPSVFILQAFTFGDNLQDGQAVGACSPSESNWSCYSHLRYPSAAEQLKLRNTVLQHAQPKLILWWSFQGTYGQAYNDTYSIYPTGTVAASRWAGLSAAVRAPLPVIAHQARAAKRTVHASRKHASRHRATKKHVTRKHVTKRHVTRKHVTKKHHRRRRVLRPTAAVRV
jgi:hypothetical protein